MVADPGSVLGVGPNQMSTDVRSGAKSDEHTQTQYVVSVAPLLDHDSDVGHLVSEFATNGVQRAGNQLLESVARSTPPL